MSLSLIIKICAHHRLLRWPFPQSVRCVTNSMLHDFLHAVLSCPSVIVKLGGLQGYTHCQERQRRAGGISYIFNIFCFQPREALKSYPCMTGSKKIVFGLEWQSQRDVGGCSVLWALFCTAILSLLSQRENAGHAMFIQRETKVIFYTISGKSEKVQMVWKVLILKKTTVLFAYNYKTKAYRVFFLLISFFSYISFCISGLQQIPKRKLEW